MSRSGDAGTRLTARSALDRRFLGLRPLVHTATVPRGGWVAAIRQALGMSAADFAARMGVAETTALSLERNERAGKVGLDTLRRAAEALDCDLVYALVPRSSLQMMVDERAKTMAAAQLRRVGHTMLLEAQGVPADVALEQLAAQAALIRDRDGLWRDA